ncbi:sensor histidine kinase [Paenibacillaceae bacterium]|nr:sensor histidine kinase [Paenibacillaceae bacterium]
MRLFLRDHFVLIMMQPLQWLLVIVIFWMDGYRNLLVAGYAAFLGCFLSAAYLIYRYVSHASYYKRLTVQPQTLDESLLDLGHAAVPHALKQMLDHQYNLLQQTLKQAERQQSTHRLFMNQWVHQMKTPLSIIELTLQENPKSEHHASIREELDRLQQGLDTVLYAARLHSFEQDFHVKTIRLPALVEQVIHDNKRLFIRSYVYPEVVHDGTINIQSDEKWLAFMLTQVLTNAIKYSAGNHQKVTVSTYVANGQAVVEVRDRGVGIPEADLKRVFNPSYTGENGRLFRESTGMGLYLVKQACQQLNHTVELESTVGEGTTVRILFSSWQT